MGAILRRYVAGQTLFNDFLLAEAGREVPPPDRQRLLGRLGSVVDDLMAAAAAAHSEEEDRRRADVDGQVQTIERLLAGERVGSEALPTSSRAITSRRSLSARAPRNGSEDWRAALTTSSWPSDARTFSGPGSVRPEGSTPGR